MVDTSSFGPTQLAIWRALRRRRTPATYNELVNRTGFSNDAVRSAVNRLVRARALRVRYDANGIAQVQGPNSSRSRR